MPSATDIVSISTGRETVLIGPRGAFGVDASYNLLVRDPATIRAVVSALAMRPGMEQVLRPYLHRWGIQTVAFRADHRAALTDAIARAAANGSLGISIVPEVTLAFAGTSIEQSAWQVTPAASKNGQLPPALIDRMAIVMEMVPDHLEGETKKALEDAIESLGMGVVVGGIVTWIGAHFIPGIDVAVLAFDLFYLSRDTIEAIKRAAQVVDDVQKAKTRADLEPAAIAFAAVVATLIVAGILNKLLKAKSLTKGVGKEGGFKEGKPSFGNKARSTNEPQNRLRSPPERTTSIDQPPRRKGGFMPKKMGEKEPGAVPMTNDLRNEIADAATVRSSGPMIKEGWPELRAQERATFSKDPMPVDLPEGTKIYRIIDSESNPNGAFWSLKPPPQSEGSWRSDAAVLNDWNGDGQYVEHTVGKGGLKGWQGPARAQLSSDGASALKGGADQFVIPPGSVDGPLVPKPTPWNQ